MISVIIPVYNVEKFLPQCLDSVISQTYGNIEIICVNDGSTDSSLSILEAYAKSDSRIKIINQNNAGVSVARNNALSVAKGKYIYFLDSDDYIEHRALKELREAIGDCDAVFANFETVDEDSEIIKHRLAIHLFLKNESKVVLPSEIDLILPSVWGKLYRKSRIDKLKLRFPVGLHYEDVFWHWVYLSNNCQVRFITDKLYNYRQRAGSVMANTRKGDSVVVYQGILITEKILQYYSDENLLKQLPGELITHLLEKSVKTSLQYSCNSNRLLVCETLKRIVNQYHFDVQSSVLLNSILKDDWTLVFSTVENFNTNIIFYRFLKKYSKKSFVRKIILSIMKKLL